MSIVGVSRPRAGWPVVVVAGLLMTGCVPNGGKSTLPQPPATAAANHWTDDGPRRVRALEAAATVLADDAKQLPGHDAAEHSKLVQRVFSDLLTVLPLLANAGSDRVLAQRMTIIQSSRAQLAGAAPDISIEPAIETGLRAASAALSDISHGDAYESADVGAVLDKLSAQVNLMERERDANLHRVDVAESVDLASQIVSKLAAALGGKLAAEPATAPTTQATGG